jgi:hypothetical protein
MEVSGGGNDRRQFMRSLNDGGISIEALAFQP